MFAKPGAPLHEEMLTVQVKNTMLRLNGQNLKLAAKNGRNSKTPGLHLSATHGKAEAPARLTASPPTREGTARPDAFKLPRPDPAERPAEKRPVRRPLKLAPLDLPEEVRVAQREKLKFGQQESKPAPCRPDASPQTRTAKPSVKPSTESLKIQLDARSSRPQLTRCPHVEPIADKHLKDVVCRGTPAPFGSKPAPPSLTPRIKAQVACGGEAARRSPGAPQQEAGRGRRLRLRRAQCLEEDQRNSNAAAAGGLPADGGKPARGVRGRGQPAERGAQRGPAPAGKGVREGSAPPGSRERGAAGESHREDGGRPSAGRSLNRQSVESGSGERGFGGALPSASNCRLKSRKALIAKHNNGVPLERLQM